MSAGKARGSGRFVGIHVAAATSGIPVGTLKRRLMLDPKLKLAGAVALGRRTQEEAHPRGEARVLAEAAGLPRMTVRNRVLAGAPPADDLAAFWGGITISARVLVLLGVRPLTARQLAAGAGVDHREIGNVLSGLRTRRQVRQGRKIRKPDGSYGPPLVPLWRLT